MCVAEEPRKKSRFHGAPLSSFFSVEKPFSWPDWYRSSLQFKGHCFLKKRLKNRRTNKERKKWRGLQGISPLKSNRPLLWFYDDHCWIEGPIEWGWYPIHLPIFWENCEKNILEISLYYIWILILKTYYIGVKWTFILSTF